MNSLSRRIFRLSLGLLIIAAGIFFTVVPGYVDRQFNQLLPMQAPPPADSVRAFHNTLRIGDMHDDILLWGRELTTQHDYGHTDLPRLKKGGVSLQVFSVVTKTPANINYQRNSGDTDQITLLMIARLAPWRAWYSLTERALYQARNLKETARAHPEMLRVVTRAPELKQALALPADQRPVIGLLAIEGMHALDGKLTNLTVLDSAGYRMIGLAHFFDNAFSGSAHGEEKYGLTDLGRKAFKEMEKRNILIDLAHASSAAIDDALELATRPLVVSHTGVKGTCDSPRNLSDEHIRRIAATGGLIGIGFWGEAVCGSAPEAVARAMRYAADIAGVDHIALGSDWDGATKEQIGAEQLPYLTAALMREGFSRQDIAKIMGENLIRLLSNTLPE